MQIAFIGDIHGNLPALEAVLSDLRRQSVQNIWCHGDISYGGAWPRECAQMVRSVCDVVTRGNTDDAITGDDSADSIAQGDRHSLGDEVVVWLQALPVEHNGEVILTHATRRSNAVRLPRLEDDDEMWRVAYGPLPAIVVCGHGHVAFARRVSADLQVLNTGSVGAPFDGDPRASYLLGTFERGAWSFEHRRVDYAREETARAFVGLGHREGIRWAHAIRTGRHP